MRKSDAYWKIKEQYQHKDIFISYPCAEISPLFII